MTDTQLRPLPRNTVVAVSGISHRQDVAVDTHIGDAVVLRHETENPHDVDAVSMWTTDNRLLGYVPRPLNSRLLVHHRGGVWAGVVVDRVGGGREGSSVGLRVKITDLIGHRDARFGANHPGLRGPAEDPTDPVEPAASQPAEAVVMTRSTRRVLGVLVGWTEDRARVRVRRPDGSTTAYPAGVVEVREPAA